MDDMRLDPSSNEPARQPEAVAASLIGQRDPADRPASTHRLVSPPLDQSQQCCRIRFQLLQRLAFNAGNSAAHQPLRLAHLDDQLGRFGWLMSLAFFCLGAASLILFAAARQDVRTRPGLFGTWGLLIIGAAYFCGGIFPPDPKRLVGSLLHGLGGLIVIFGSPMVFTLVSKGFIRNEAPATIARLLIWTAALTWLSLASFYGSIVAFGGAPRSGSIIVGWTNRILITSFVLWLLVAAFHVRSRPISVLRSTQPLGGDRRPA